MGSQQNEARGIALAEANYRRTNQCGPTPTTSINSITGWAGVYIHMQFYQVGGMSFVILLDNQYTASNFSHKDLEENIHQVDVLMILKKWWRHGYKHES
jgi:hypothetical protein